MLVIGTAGHIDHGKSSIVKRLTGTDPDRLPEEKARGMTIDLGFAFCKSKSGDTIAFVDVPGHERFVRNMIAGVGGIDAVILVVAADDGWMPQTEEHFQIVRMLGITDGLIVLNKIDLVDQETIERVTRDVRERVGTSFVHSAPLIPVSSTTGQGFELLRDNLDELSAGKSVRKRSGRARLHIDRTFDLPGIGAVATGTLRDGTLRVGQQVCLWPSNKQAKIRTLHSDDEAATEVTPSQRTAVSLSGVAKETIVRGGVMTDRDDLSFLLNHPVLAMRVELLASSPVPLKNRRRLTALTGTAAVDGEIRMFENGAIAPGEGGVVFFLPDEPLFALVGDPIILRLPTPMVTIGGGRLLDHLVKMPRQREIAQFRYVHERNVDSMESLILTELKKRYVMKREELLVWSNSPSDEIGRTRAQFVRERKIEEHEGLIAVPEFIRDSSAYLLTELSDALAQRGSSRDQYAKSAERLNLTNEAAAYLLELLARNGLVEESGSRYRLHSASNDVDSHLTNIITQIRTELSATPYTPPALSRFAERGKEYRDAIGLLLDNQEVHKCGSEFILLTDSWQEVIRFVRQRLKAADSMMVNDLKERFAITRKHAIPILEELDRLQITKRTGDVRVKGARFEA